MRQKIEIIRTKTDITSQFIQLRRVFFKEDGIEKSWDYIKTHNSVAALLYHTEKKALLFVKQFRLPVFMQHSDTDGFTCEMCAGILDKDKNMAETMQEEILEECGYDVPLTNLEEITTCYGVGYSGSSQTIYFAKINESMKKSNGGGICNENIEPFFVSLEEAEEFMYGKMPKTANTKFAIIWFLRKLDKKLINLD